jgi:hypothetical protein
MRINVMVRVAAVAAFICVASGLVGQSSKPAVPDGRQLATGQYCYTITAVKDGVETPVGVTFQSVSRGQSGGIETLAIVVHQHLFSGKFDMRDSFLLRRDDLRPIRLDTDRDGTPHVHLEYSDHHISGWKAANGAKKAISIDLNAPVWDGNLWGETFAAMPLSAGASLTLPTYQYDSGLGTFYIDVQGRRQEELPKGRVQAWIIKAGLSPSEQVQYTVSTHPGLEFAYAAGPSAQHMGGDCSGIN